MSSSLIIGLACGGAYLIWAFFKDKNLWRNKPREVLEEMIRGGDWMRLQVALEEVKRRGEDIRPYAPLVVKLLVSESKLERTTGIVALRKLYSDLASGLADFEGTATRESCVGKAKPLLERFGILP